MNPNEKPKEKVEKKLLRLVDIFLPGDIATVRMYILKEVIGPTLKKLLYDIIVGSSYRMIFPSGQNAPPPPGTTKIQYSGERNSLSGTVTTTEIQMRQTSFYANTPVIASRQSAEIVLRNLIETQQNYGIARVADFYDELRNLGYRVESDYTANDYCWDDLSKVEIIPAQGGYQLKLPRPKPIPR